MAYCGARTIGTYTDQATYQNFLELKTDDRELIIGTNDNSNAGTHSFTVIDFVGAKVIQELTIKIDIAERKARSFFNECL